MYERKTVGHIFPKPVQIEGTTQNFFPQKVVFHHSLHFCRWVSVQAESSGRSLTAEDYVERVRTSFLHSPMKSTGGAATELSTQFH
jgi:hypothetical protein